MNFFSIFKRNILFKLKKKIDIDKDQFEKDTDLDTIFNFYKTDKSNFLNNKKILGHGFSKFYEKYLTKFKNEELNILEIGSFSGASAAAFAKYFPRSKIYCIDINLTKFIYKSQQIYPYGLDVSNKKSVENFLKKIQFLEKIKFFDIIIDDGSHILSHQLVALNYFFKYTKKKGFYIIEDYKFPEYFSHLKDVSEPSIPKIIESIKNKQNISSNLLDEEIKNKLNKNNLNIYEHKGQKDISDILFLEKLY